MSTDYTSFVSQLTELVDRFREDEAAMRASQYDEATVRLEYLDPFFEALGWNVRNNPPQPLHLRDVVVENRMSDSTRTGKVDYLFRTAGLDRWVCEAKRPFENISRHYFQVQNYTYNMRLWLGVLCSFEELIVFVVGGRPQKDRPFSPVDGWRLHYSQYVQFAQPIWNLLSRQAVEAGSIEKFIQALPKVRTKARQGWLIKPDRTKTVDVHFLAFLEDQRARFAKDLVKRNPDVAWSGDLLAQSLQQIFDRMLFQRVSEDRNIDVGTPLGRTLQEWEGRGKLPNQLWPAITANFRHLSATFNGGVYGKDARTLPFADNLSVSDGLLADFIEEIAGDTSEWLFGTMPLWLIGSVYERFLGSELDARGHVSLKLDVRKAGGVYYTPESVVRQVVDVTVGRLLEGKTPADILRLKIIDPSCGSGSFLLVVFDRILHHCQDWFEANRAMLRSEEAFFQNDRLYLTTAFKRRVLQSCIFGVDIDAVAVQVARMSLCLRVLEDETQEALAKEKVLFPKQTFLPDLDQNIICANSLVPVDSYPDHFDANTLADLNPVDWQVLKDQTNRKQGFDAVVGNPPWGATISGQIAPYLRITHRAAIRRMPDTYIYFTHLCMEHLLRTGGVMGLVLPGTILNQSDAQTIRSYLLGYSVDAVADLGEKMFGDALNTTSIVVASKLRTGKPPFILANDVSKLDRDMKDHALGRWRRITRESWEGAVSVDPSATFFTRDMVDVDRLTAARQRFPTLATLVDGFGIQRGVTPELVEATIIEPALAVTSKIEPAVVRPTLRGEDVRAFGVARATMKLLYMSDDIELDACPNAIKHLSATRSKISCSEVKAGVHPWWRLHRPRNRAIFDRPKFIGLTTSRNIALVWDAEGLLVVTDAMFVFAPRSNVPMEYLMGVMHSSAFAYLYKVANQGDARVIPQIKATKLAGMPIPEWDGSADQQLIVETVKSLMELTSPADRVRHSLLRRMNGLVDSIYGMREYMEDVA